MMPDAADKIAERIRFERAVNKHGDVETVASIIRGEVAGLLEAAKWALWRAQETEDDYARCPHCRADWQNRDFPLPHDWHKPSCPWFRADRELAKWKDGGK